MNYKKSIFLILILGLALPTFAQGDAGMMTWIVENIIIVLGGVAVTGAMFYLYSSTKMIWKSQMIAKFKAEGMDAAAAEKATSRESYWDYMYNKLSGTVPMEQEADMMLEHDYDGIRELDNNLPPWWLGMFYISIAMSVVYMFVYHGSDIGASQIEGYELEVKEAQLAIAAYNLKEIELEKAKEAEGGLTKSSVTVLTDEASLAKGKELFGTTCIACHGKLAEGVIGLGPNLTDEYWLHGGGVKNIFNTITKGIPKTTMIAWKSSLEPEQIQQVASFILTLQGSNPPNAKEKEGEIWSE